MPDARLRITDPQGRRFVAIDRALFTIGRRTAADLQFSSSDVSREHADITRDGDRYVLRDRGSRFGTFVNGEPVTERTLADGDRIRLGRTDAIELVFEDAQGGLRDTTTDVTDLRQMAAILNGLRALGSGRVLPEVLMLVMDSALDVTKAERGFVMLANTAGVLEFKVARGRGGQTLPGTSFTTSSKIPREVFSTGEPRVERDLMEGNLAAVHDGTIAIGIRYVLCVPLKVVPMGQNAAGPGQDRVIGVLYLDGRERNTMLSKNTLGDLEVFAQQAAIAIESARLYAEEAEKARTDRDLRVAAEIQRALLADPAYQGSFCDLAAVSVPCRTVGGDFYDYLQLEGGAFAFALGDVAGKGPPAALQAAAVQTNFAALAPVSENPAAAMTRINVALLRRAVEARFATMFYGTLEESGRLEFCNAGQEPPIVVQSGGNVQRLDVGGPVLGLLSQATYESGTTTLERGDIVVVCSDGITEALNAAGEEFGRDRLEESLQSCHGLQPEAAIDVLMGAVRSFVGGAAQADDITAMVVRYWKEVSQSPSESEPPTQCDYTVGYRIQSVAVDIGPGRPGGSQERAMQLEQRVDGEVVVVKVTGDITLSKGADVILKDKINSLLQQGYRKLLLDLGGVSYVDSAGLGQLVQMHATTMRQNGVLKLLNVTKRLHDLLVVTRLLVVFETFEDEKEALDSFRKPPAGV